MPEPIEPVVQVTQEPEPKPAVQITEPVVETELWEDGKPFDPAKAKDLIQKLRDENKQLKPQAKKASEYEAEEKKRKEAEMTELQKKEARIAELEAAQKASDLRELRRKVGEEAKLPAAIYELLPELPESEMKAKAIELAKALPPALPHLNANNPSRSGDTITDEQRRAFLFGNGPLPK